MKLTANPNADALCLMNDTAVKTERERAVSTHSSTFVIMTSFINFAAA